VTDPEPGFLREVGLIEGRYFVCPGNKWWHKNHRVIIRALALLKDFGEIKVVFTGSERGAGPIIRSDATKLGVANQIVDLGHRTYSEVQAVVSGSIAVLMPSLLGPTNLPPLEALAHGKPAIVSSVHDFEPEIQSRLIVLNPSEPSDWAHEMRNLIESPIQAEPFFYASEDEVLTLLSHVIEKFKDRSKIWLASAEFTEDGEKNASGL
jgi:glycosyltransferase involved in cell wall biosynthesis